MKSSPDPADEGRHAYVAMHQQGLQQRQHHTVKQDPRGRPAADDALREIQQPVTNNNM